MWSLAALLLVGLAGVQAQDQCYYAAGKAALDQYIPCGGGSGVSACCLAGDFCLQDGACYSPSTQMTYIAGCTDSTYSDSTCKGGSDTCGKGKQKSPPIPGTRLIPSRHAIPRSRALR